MGELRLTQTKRSGANTATVRVEKAAPVAEGTERPSRRRKIKSKGGQKGKSKSESKMTYA